MRFKQWCADHSRDVFDLINRSAFRCMPKSALLPEDFATHADVCSAHGVGSSDLIRRTASRWLSADKSPKLHLNFYEFSCGLIGNSRAFWLPRTESRRWRAVVLAGEREKKTLKEMMEIAEIWRTWGYGDEPSLEGLENQSGQFVYFIVAPEVARIKIGYTGEPKKRFSGIRSVGPCPFKVLAILPGTLRHEQLFHSFFVTERLPGTEWFAATLRVLRFVELARKSSSCEELRSLYMKDRPTVAVAILSNQEDAAFASAPV